MNGKPALNIDEEALFEVLATANFATPAARSIVRMPAAVIESTAEASSTFPWLVDPENYNAASTAPSSLF